MRRMIWVIISISFSHVALLVRFFFCSKFFIAMKQVSACFSGTFYMQLFLTHFRYVVIDMHTYQNCVELFSLEYFKRIHFVRHFSLSLSFSRSFLFVILHKFNMRSSTHYNMQFNTLQL